MPDDAYVYVSEPRRPYSSPTLNYGGIHGDCISWTRFNALIDGGDLVERGRTTMEVDGESWDFIKYEISPAGRAALEALPNFDRRAKRQQAVTL